MRLLDPLPHVVPLILLYRDCLALLASNTTSVVPYSFLCLVLVLFACSYLARLAASDVVPLGRSFRALPSRLPRARC